jgi:hypothetical protein
MEVDHDGRPAGWAREYFEAMRPHLSPAVYVNDLDEDEGDERVRSAYGNNYEGPGGVEEDVRLDELVPFEPEHPPRRAADVSSALTSHYFRIRSLPGILVVSAAWLGG